MNQTRKLALILLAAIFAIAVLCMSPRAPAQPPRGTVFFHPGAGVVNPRPNQDDDTGDDAGDPSGDATPVPDPAAAH